MTPPIRGYPPAELYLPGHPHTKPATPDQGGPAPRAYCPQAIRYGFDSVQFDSALNGKVRVPCSLPAAAHDRGHNGRTLGDVFAVGCGQGKQPVKVILSCMAMGGQQGQCALGIAGFERAEDSRVLAEDLGGAPFLYWELRAHSAHRTGIEDAFLAAYRQGSASFLLISAEYAPTRTTSG